MSTLGLVAVKKANSMLGVIGKGIENKIGNVTVHLCTLYGAVFGIPGAALAATPQEEYC